MSTLPSPTLDGAVLEALRDSVGGDVAFVADLVQTYLEDGAHQLDAIEAAVAAGDAPGLVRPAHTLKSASLTLGVMRLGELSRSLERRGRAIELAGAEADAIEARSEWAAVQEALIAWLALPASGT
ncbi:MAG TPA: Hpt domain-containing protein [Candidatus Limnocylindrales bacterium]